MRVFVCVCLLTFDHDHVDVDGANGRLGQPLPFLQDVGDFPGGDAVVWLASECHQLPDGHSWQEEGGVVRREEVKDQDRARSDITVYRLQPPDGNTVHSYFFFWENVQSICVNQASDGDDTHRNSTRRSDG